MSPTVNYRAIIRAWSAGPDGGDTNVLVDLLERAAPDPFGDDYHAGIAFAHHQLCEVLGVDPDTVTWDAATETLEGDVFAVTANILTAWAGEDWQDRAAQPFSAEEDDVRARVAEVVEECSHDGIGLWRSCTGCHETEDGYDVGHYPHSKSYGCKLGGGCSECGGVGAVWDTTDYAALGEALAAQLDKTAQPETPAAITDDIPTLLVAVQRRWPGSFWHLAKGRLTAAEPLYGFQVVFGLDEVLAEGEGETEISAIRAALQSIPAKGAHP